MNRKQHKIDSSHDRMVFTMEADSEALNWVRAFPDPLPVGYRLVHRWSIPKKGHPGVLEVWPEAVEVPPAAPIFEYLETDKTLPNGEPRPPAEPPDARKALEAKPKAELI